MPEVWKQWQGEVVNGKFPLLRYLGGSEHSAVFLTERREGERLLRAGIKLIPAIEAYDEPQLSRWRLTAELSHPHLISLFECGRSELCEVSLLYVVMEFAEENLAEILPKRALEPVEARAMLEPVLGVLEYLHAHGFVHGHIKPTNIMANGDQLKVSSDGLRRAGELAGGPDRPDAYDPPEYAHRIPATEAMTPAGDVWSLGVTLVETLTQNLPTQQGAEQEDPLLSQALPEPFLDIARHCLLQNAQSRWTVDQILSRLRDSIPVSQARLTTRPPQRATRPRQLSTRRYTRAILVAAGLVLAAVLAGARLLRHRPEVQQTSDVALQRQAPPNHEMKVPELRPTVGSGPGAIGARRQTTEAVPAPAPVDAGAAEDQANTTAKRQANATIRGEVVQEVLPDVPEIARDTIRGTVRVAVKVDVDPLGSVKGAELESPGPSKYFARLALQSAQRWTFKAPEVAGRSVSSGWTLRFRFTSAGTTVIPTQEAP